MQKKIIVVDLVDDDDEDVEPIVPDRVALAKKIVSLLIFHFPFPFLFFSIFISFLWKKKITTISLFFLSSGSREAQPRYCWPLL